MPHTKIKSYLIKTSNFSKLPSSQTFLDPVPNRIMLKNYTDIFFVLSLVQKYEGQLISNAHSEISRKRDHVLKQKKVGGKVQYFSYKLTYLFFDIVALSFNTFGREPQTSASPEHHSLCEQCAVLHCHSATKSAMLTA
jgi:hypothetical protein